MAEGWASPIAALKTPSDRLLGGLRFTLPATQSRESCPPCLALGMVIAVALASTCFSSTVQILGWSESLRRVSTGSNLSFRLLQPLHGRGSLLSYQGWDRSTITRVLFKRGFAASKRSRIRVMSFWFGIYSFLLYRKWEIRRGRT